MTLSGGKWAKWVANELTEPEQTLSGNPTVLFPFPEEKEQRLAIERKKNGTGGGGGGGYGWFQ